MSNSYPDQRCRWWVAGTILPFGLAVGSRMSVIAGAVLLVAIVGWVFEYYRGYSARLDPCSS
ncbi:cytochrome c oxidase subunit 4 [Herbiconiux sp. CPCC 205763]|uniref:Cytochrome c oxidase subunit 4 n=1 Tax=Herbiconiux aconitum TaxID=2970913 RepID=A0ABT2GU21_9MICO|nr:cytochrome c oxidase subunit 4 [Herbiconiux aconitum]MCS5719709.1 cytochrome c oxidase subunit 4 [Herbiconiux aconitum]